MGDTADFDTYQKKHLKIIQGIFSEVCTQEKYTTVSNSSIPGAYYNNITEIHVADDEREAWLSEIEDDYKLRSKSLTLYVTPSTSPTYLGQLLKQRGYGDVYRDSWLSRDTSSSTVSVPSGLKVIRVDNSDKVRQFSDTFKSAYGITEPSNGSANSNSPYTEMWLRAEQSGKAKLFLVTDGNRPEGCVALIHDHEAGGIYGVSIPPEVKRPGLRELLYNLCIQEAYGLKLGTVFIQVEPRGLDEQYLKESGFRILGTAEALQARMAIR